MLSKGGFTAAVAAKDGNKAPLLNIQIQVLKYGDAGRVIHARIGIRQMFCRNCGTQSIILPNQGVHLPVEPQGNIMPVDLTGRPNSPTCVGPPCFSPNTTSEA